MTYEPMTCDAVADQLPSYLDGELLEPMRLALEAHAASCAECGSLLADLDAIRHEAAALPVLEPSRDLWSGIAARIDAPVVALDDARRARAVVRRRTWLRPSLAAAALILLTAGVTHYFTRASIESDELATGRGQASRVAQVGTPAGSPPASEVSPSSTGALGAFEASGPETEARGTTRTTASTTPAAQLASAVPVMKETQPVYDQEISKLRAIVKERRSQLDPSTVAVLEQSIAVIDSAIAQSRAALAKDPASGFLATQLNHSLEKKVELLRTAALLPSRT
ncbi:MAG TPA: zf-HC2 domain-containing protein [Gemmatimonadaceae bacterium]|nr:zf-HC2 domain-containing protein [Gemmatimonadaceae bacterium]